MSLSKWFKDMYKQYTLEYKNIINKMIDNEKKEIHDIITLIFKERGISQIITDYSPYKCINREYHFEKVDELHDHAFFYTSLTLNIHKEILNVLIIFLKKEKYLNKKHLQQFTEGITFLMNNIHIFYSLCLELEKTFQF